MENVLNYMTKQEDLDENNILEYLNSYHNSGTQKSNDEINNVWYYLIMKYYIQYNLNIYYHSLYHRFVKY